MKFTHLVLVAALAAAPFVSEQAAFAQSDDKAEQRRAAMEQLQADMKTAMANANLSAEQKQMLESSRDTLRQAGEAKREGKDVDRKKVRGAMKDMQKVIDSDAFRPEDKQRLKDDMKKLQEASGGRRGLGRRLRG